MKKNYFLSGWIANLGVVPLLRSAFLRFSPSFFVLLALRMLVCCVLDPINNLLMSKERSKLANNKLFVKALLVLPLGGHYDWEGLSGDYFQVVPMGCVKVTLMAPHNVPKLVAQKEGKCEVILFDKSHRRHRKQVQVVASSATTPPRTQQKAQKKEERVAVSWSKESRNRAVEEIYRLFYASSLDSISCQLPSIHGALQCFYDEATAPPALMLEKLKKKICGRFLAY